MNWTIIGCGWLGKELGSHLVKDKQLVFGSTRSKETFSELKARGIKPFILCEKPQISTEIKDLTEIVVLSIPPFDRDNIMKYGNYLTTIALQFKENTKFIFLSSTGVYPKRTGQYFEDYHFSEEESHNALRQAEIKLMNTFSSRLTILRLGGLMGEDRHPIKFLAGKTNVSDPKGVINYIHRGDIIAAITKLVEEDVFGEIFNVVHPSHPIREKYFIEKAIFFHLKPPTFSQESSITRIIRSDKIQAKLGLLFENDI